MALDEAGRFRITTKLADTLGQDDAGFSRVDAQFDQVAIGFARSLFGADYDNGSYEHHDGLNSGSAQIATTQTVIYSRSVRRSRNTPQPVRISATSSRSNVEIKTVSLTRSASTSISPVGLAIKDEP